MWRGHYIQSVSHAAWVAVEAGMLTSARATALPPASSQAHYGSLAVTFTELAKHKAVRAT